MKTIISYFKKYATIRYIGVSMILVILLGIIIENPWFGQMRLIDITDGIEMIDMNMFISPDKIYIQLANMGADGRKLYQSLLLLDYLVILGFGIFQIISILVLVKCTGKSKNWEHLITAPIMRGVLDAIENIFLFISSWLYPTKYQILLKIISVIIFMKWLMFWSIIAIFLYLLANYLIRNILGGKE